MMTAKKTILLFCTSICAFLFSCHKLLIQPDPSNDPERNFEIFWNDLNNGYPYFEEDKIDWKARYEKFRPLISSKTSTQELFTIMGDMLYGFSDGHLEVKYQGDYIGNEKSGENYFQLVRANQNGDYLNSTAPVYYYIYRYKNICQSYIDPATYRVVNASNGIDANSSDTVCFHGILKDENILYVNFTTFFTDYDFGSLLKNLFVANPGVKGLVLDVRMNGGGNLGIMWEAMANFVPSGSQMKYGYNKEKVGPLPENFGPEKYFGVEGAGVAFSKGIVLLANRGTVSAAEHATMAMRQAKQYNSKIKIVGDYTFGATSFIVQRTLPCGIQYTLVNSKTWDINRVIIEKTGVKPDLTSYLTADKVAINQDDQLEKAIEIIKTNSF